MCQKQDSQEEEKLKTNGANTTSMTKILFTIVVKSMQNIQVKKIFVSFSDS